MSQTGWQELILLLLLIKIVDYTVITLLHKLLENVSEMTVNPKLCFDKSIIGKNNFCFNKYCLRVDRSVRDRGVELQSRSRHQTPLNPCFKSLTKSYNTFSTAGWSHIVVTRVNWYVCPRHINNVCTLPKILNLYWKEDKTDLSPVEEANAARLKAITLTNVEELIVGTILWVAHVNGVRLTIHGQTWLNTWPNRTLYPRTRVLLHRKVDDKVDRLYLQKPGIALGMIMCPKLFFHAIISKTSVWMAVSHPEVAKPSCGLARV